MSKFFSRRPKTKGPLPSAGYFLEWAGLLTVLFLVVNIAGMRPFTSVLNGTIGSTTLDWQTASFLGAAYVMVYLAFVLGAPTLIIAAGILTLWRKLTRNPETNEQPKSPA
jgi:hypothetical protein